MVKMMLAKAVYDNDAETSDELTFKQGDVVNVLQVDFNGLEGWWLCSLRGKTGIAPGNRLKQINDVFNGERVDVNTEKSTNNNTLDKVVTPKKVGDVFIYDSPTMQNYARNTTQDYDQPRPGAHAGRGMHIKQQQLIEHVQNKLQLEHIRAIESLYDSPGNPKIRMLNFPESNRSSSVSMSSILSSISGTGSTGSAPPSERSSGDANHDLYDSPSAPTSTNRFKMQKSKSSNDVLDSIATYDYPTRSLRSVVGQFEQSEPLYHTPGPPRPVCIDEGGDYCEIHDNETPTPTQKLAPAFNPFTQGHVEDGVQDYDRPKSVPFGSYNNDYDVPKESLNVVLPEPQKGREHTSSGPPEAVPNLRHKELRLEVGTAVTLLNKQQQDLHKSVERLLAYVGSGWRKKHNLEPKLFDIKISCIAVKTALEEFVEFGQGAVANSSSTGDGSIYFACKSYFNPVNAKLMIIQSCMKGLDDIKWDITKLSMETLESCAVDDELNELVSACRDLVVLARQLAAFIQGKAAVLFQDYQLTSASIALQSPPTEESIAVPSRPTLKPKPRPPVLKPKPKLGSLSSRDESVKSPVAKSPPIQPKPMGLRNVAVEQIKTKSTEDQTYDTPKSIVQSDDYDVPKTKSGRTSAVHKLSAIKVTPAKLASFDDGNKDYDNSELRYRLSQLEGYNNEPEDYDYAALTPDMHKASLQYKYDQETITKTEQAGLLKAASQVSHGNVNQQSTATNENALNLYDTPNKAAINQPMNSSNQDYDTPPSKTHSHCYNTPVSGHQRWQNPISQELYDSPVNRSTELYDSPSSSQQGSPGSTRSSIDSRLRSELDMSGQIDKMQVPSIRTSGLSPKFKEKLERLQTDSEIAVLKHRDSQSSVTSDLSTRPSSDTTSIASSTISVISDSDKQVLAFYADQLDSHVTVLVNAMDALFQAVDYNQPPKVFIAHSKFVILAAHKLVYIGDTICRNISSDRVRGDVMGLSNQLCDSLKATVTATKQAALQYPSVQAMQEMVNKATYVSQITNNLKSSIMRNV